MYFVIQQLSYVESRMYVLVYNTKESHSGCPFYMSVCKGLSGARKDLSPYLTIK